MNATETLEDTVLLRGDLVPLALIAAEIEQSVGWVAHHFGEAVTVDDVGMRAVPATEARAFFTERAELKARQVEDARRRTEESSKKRTLAVGVAAQEGMTAVESIMASDGYTSFNDEYGRPAPTFLEDMLEEGQRTVAERQARAKEQAAKKLKDDLR